MNGETGTADAVGHRLDAMLQAVTTVQSALNDFYAMLTDEQKARFEAIGPQRVSQSDQPTSQGDQPRVRRSHHRGRSIENRVLNLIRSF